MLPRLAPNDVVCSRWRKPELCGDILDHGIAVGMQSAHSLDLLGGHLRRSILLARMAAPLPCTVAHIVTIGTEK